MGGSIGWLMLPSPVLPEVLLGRLPHQAFENARVRRHDAVDVEGTTGLVVGATALAST